MNNLFALFLYLFASWTTAFAGDLDYSDLKAVARSTPELKLSPDFPKTTACTSFLSYVQNEMNSYGLVVAKEGKVLVENYYRGAEPQNKFRLYSISKTVSGLLLASLVEQGKVTLDTPVSKYLPLKKMRGDKADRTQMKIGDLWNMGSGLDWCEYRSCQARDPMSLMYGMAREDGVKFVLNHKQVGTPGKLFTYSAGNYMLLQAAIKGVVGEQDYENLPFENIFKHLGMNPSDYVFEQDDKGIIMGGTGLSLNLRNFASLGQFLYRKGKAGDKEIISEDLFNKMISLDESPLLGKETPQTRRDWEGPTGASLWLNTKKYKNIPQFFPRIPEDMYYTGGKFGQFLIVLPSSKIVLARIGADENHAQHWNPFTEKALECLDDKALVDAPTKKVEDPAPDWWSDLNALKNIVQENVLINLRAQEYCSCRFVGGFKSIDTCAKLLPQPPGLEEWSPVVNKVNIDEKNQSVEVVGTLRAVWGAVSQEVGRAKAVFDPAHPQRGCKLVKRAPPWKNRIPLPQ